MSTGVPKPAFVGEASQVTLESYAERIAGMRHVKRAR